MHQVGDLFELNVKLRCQNVKRNYKTTKESNQLISNLERVTSSMELFKTLNILPLPCTCAMEVVYYIKFNVGKLEQNFVRHDYNSCQLPDLQTRILYIQYLKKENNMGIKLLLD